MIRAQIKVIQFRQGNRVEMDSSKRMTREDMSLCVIL